jgi:hypothetical protein
MRNPTFDPDIASLIRAMLAVIKNERTLPLVTAGLDPAVHADSPQTK